MAARMTAHWAADTVETPSLSARGARDWVPCVRRMGSSEALGQSLSDRWVLTV